MNLYQEFRSDTYLIKSKTKYSIIEHLIKNFNLYNLKNDTKFNSIKNSIKKEKYIDLILENKYNSDSTMNPFCFGYGYYFKINPNIILFKKKNLKFKPKKKQRCVCF